MKNQIIVNIDPLNIQHNVVEYAIRIARRLDLPLLLYSVQQHVMMPVAAETGGQSPGVNPQMLPPDWEETVSEKAEKYCEEIKRAYPKTSFEHDLGMLADTVSNKLNYLYESTSKRSPYLLVMPKGKGYNWWDEIIGTAETAIASEAPCPVMFVPEDKELVEVDRILYLADRTALEKVEYPGFTTLNTLSVYLKAKITVGFIAGKLGVQPAFNVGAAMEMLRQSLPNQSDHEFRFFSDYSAEQILALAKLTQMDMVAFPFREANLFERFFNDEVTRTLVLRSELPTIVF